MQFSIPVWKGVKSILGMILLVSLACAAQAGGFYKWRDVNGVMHITDHPPDNAAGVEVDSDTRINKALATTTRRQLPFIQPG